MVLFFLDLPPLHVRSFFSQRRESYVLLGGRETDCLASWKPRSVISHVCISPSPAVAMDFSVSMLFIDSFIMWLCKVTIRSSGYLPFSGYFRLWILLLQCSLLIHSLCYCTRPPVCSSAYFLSLPEPTWSEGLALQICVEKMSLLGVVVMPNADPLSKSICQLQKINATSMFNWVFDFFHSLATVGKIVTLICSMVWLVNWWWFSLSLIFTYITFVDETSDLEVRGSSSSRISEITWTLGQVLAQCWWYWNC